MTLVLKSAPLTTTLLPRGVGCPQSACWVLWGAPHPDPPHRQCTQRLGGAVSHSNPGPTSSLEKWG